MAVRLDVATSERRRADECRLVAARRLETFDDAVAFLDDRGMLTRTPDSALPSLFAACQEPPSRAGGKGFASWPATKWWWAGALEQADSVATLKVHNGKNLLLGQPALALADPICRAELARFLSQPVRSEEDRLTHRLLDHLAAAGPSSLGSVQLELGVHSRALRALRHPLERCGVVVSRQVIVAGDTDSDTATATATDRRPGTGGDPGTVGDPVGTGHVHSSELCRYDQLVPTPLAPERDPHDALEDLVAVGLRAAVLAPETELARWFSWRWYARPDLLERLVDTGRAVRLGGGLVAAPLHA